MAWWCGGYHATPYIWVVVSVGVVEFVCYALMVIGAGSIAFAVMAVFTCMVERFDSSRYLRERDKRRLDHLEKRVKALEAKQAR